MCGGVGGGGVVSWRVHEVVVCVDGSGMGGWRVHRVGAYTHPPMKLQH